MSQAEDEWSDDESVTEIVWQETPSTQDQEEPAVQALGPEHPFIRFPELEKQPIQSASGVLGQVVDDEEPYGPTWMKQQDDRKIKMLMDPVYQFVTLVAGKTNSSISQYWSGPVDGHETGSFTHNVNGEPQIEHADYNRGFRLAAEMIDTKRYNPLNDVVKEDGELAQRPPVKSKWKMMLWLLLKENQITPQQLDILNQLYANETPNRRAWTALAENCGRFFLKEIFVAALDEARDLVWNDLRKSHISLYDLMTQIHVRSRFADMVAVCVGSIRSLHPSRYMTVNNSKILTRQRIQLIRWFKDVDYVDDLLVHLDSYNPTGDVQRRQREQRQVWRRRQPYRLGSSMYM